MTIGLKPDESLFRHVGTVLTTALVSGLTHRTGLRTRCPPTPGPRGSRYPLRIRPRGPTVHRATLVRGRCRSTDPGSPFRAEFVTYSLARPTRAGLPYGSQEAGGSDGQRCAHWCCRHDTTDPFHCYDHVHATRGVEEQRRQRGSDRNRGSDRFGSDVSMSETVRRRCW